MNEINLAVNKITMSSREIAELTDKRHNNVKRDIIVMFEQLSEDVRKFEHIYFDSMNREQTEYLLEREYVECLLTGYSAILRMKVIKRLRELENNRPLLPQTLPEALRLAADLAEENIQLESQLALAAPKVAFAERVGDARGVLIGNFAKTIGMGQNTLFSWLRDNGFLIKSGSRRNVPLQEYLDRQYFSLKETPIDTHHGVEISFTTLITGKGQLWLTTQLLGAGILKTVGSAA